MTIARDFEKDEEICKAADAGPWTYDVYTRQGLTRYAVKGLMGVLMERTFHHPVFGTDVFQKAENNLTFAAEAREGWPAALEEIKVLKKLIHDLQLDSEAYRLGFAAAITQARQLIDIEKARTYQSAVSGDSTPDLPYLAVFNKLVDVKEALAGLKPEDA